MLPDSSEKIINVTQNKTKQKQFLHKCLLDKVLWGKCNTKAVAKERNNAGWIVLLYFNGSQWTLTKVLHSVVMPCPGVALGNLTALYTYSNGHSSSSSAVFQILIYYSQLQDTMVQLRAAPALQNLPALKAGGNHEVICFRDRNSKLTADLDVTVWILKQLGTGEI